MGIENIPWTEADLSDVFKRLGWRYEAACILDRPQSLRTTISNGKLFYDVTLGCEDKHIVMHKVCFDLLTINLSKDLVSRTKIKLNSTFITDPTCCLRFLVVLLYNCIQSMSIWHLYELMQHVMEDFPVVLLYSCTQSRSI